MKRMGRPFKPLDKITTIDGKVQMTCRVSPETIARLRYNLELYGVSYGKQIEELVEARYGDGSR